MTNFELLQYLKNEGILYFEDYYIDKSQDFYITAFDSDGWNSTIIHFDKEGNVIK